MKYMQPCSRTGKVAGANTSLLFSHPLTFHFLCPVFSHSLYSPFPTYPWLFFFFLWMTSKINLISCFIHKTERNSSEDNALPTNNALSLTWMAPDSISHTSSLPVCAVFFKRSRSQIGKHNVNDWCWTGPSSHCLWKLCVSTVWFPASLHLSL